LYEKYIMPRSANSISEAQELIRLLVDIPITNAKLGITAVLSNRSIKKLGSEKAAKKSVSPRLHAKAVANVDILFENAKFQIKHPSTGGNGEIYRLGALILDEKTNALFPIKLTVKVLDNNRGNRIYSAEVLEFQEKTDSAGQSTGDRQHIICATNRQVPIAESNYIDKKLNSAGRLTLGSRYESLFVPITEFNTKMQELLNNVKNS